MSTFENSSSSDVQEEIVSLPGFGFYPKEIVDQLDELSVATGIESVTNDTNFKNEFKCKLLTTLFKKGVFIRSGESEEISSLQGWCAPLWDNISCFPASPPGSISVIPCMEEFDGIPFNTEDNATHECFADGTWAAKTNYNSCSVLHMEPHYTNVGNVNENRNWVLLIYWIGYSLSIVALILALFILLGFREMRCLRNKIHTNLFLTFLLSNSSFIFTSLVQHYWLSDDSMVTLCINHALVRYFHLTTFFWMFVEGLYLFLQVKAPLNVAVVKLRHYIIIGWGLPVVVLLKWSILAFYLYTPESNTNRDLHMAVNSTGVIPSDENVNKCPFVKGADVIEWAYTVPVILLLGCNIFFLFWIMAVVISQIRGTTPGSSETHYQHWKAAKALLIIIPLLGITYLLTVVGPTDPQWANLLFIHLRAVLLSTQGFVITLPYCFLNGEVRNILRLNWERWQAMRNLYPSTRSTRNSISMVGFHSTVTAVENLSWRESRFSSTNNNNRCQSPERNNSLNKDRSSLAPPSSLENSASSPLTSTGSKTNGKSNGSNKSVSYAIIPESASLLKDYDNNQKSVNHDT